MFRSFALAVTAALALGSTAKADVVFTGPGGPIPAFVGFDPSPGNTLNVGGVTAVNNFLTGSGSTDFTSFSQAQIIAAITSGGFANLPSGADYTAVFGITERVTGAAGIAGTGNAVATFGLAPTQTVNYFEIWQGGTASNNTTGQGFNGAGGATLVLAGTITSLTTTGNIVSNATTTPPLDQFGTNDYPGNNTTLINGSFSLSGNITSANAAYFGGANLVGTTFNITTNVADPFQQVNPSAAFLINTTSTAGSGVAPTAGAGLGTQATGAGIGSINGANGNSAQVQNDASIVFGPAGTNVPEPASLAVFGLMAGMGGLVYRRRAVKQAA